MLGLSRIPCLLTALVPMQSLDEVGSWLTSLDCQEGMLQQCWQLHNSSQRQPASGPINDQACSGSAAGNPAAHAWLPTNQEQWQQAWGLPDPALVPAWQTGPDLQQLQPANRWSQYYDSRGLPHSSPAGSKMLSNLQSLQLCKFTAPAMSLKSFCCSCTRLRWNCA